MGLISAPGSGLWSEIRRNDFQAYILDIRSKMYNSGRFNPPHI